LLAQEPPSESVKIKRARSDGSLVPPVVTITTAMQSGESGKPPVWKERREWLTAIVAGIGVCVSVGAYLISRNSANSSKALILVADKADNPAGALGLSFVFHPLNQGQKISSLAMVFPPSISTASQTALPPTQEIDLAVSAVSVEHFISSHYPRSQPAYLAVWDGNIPVILEAQYVFADESLTHRGLYKLRTHIVWRESGRPFDVSFQDVVFDRSIEEGTDYSQALTHALIVEEQARRKLFDPSTR
jgi:hypothetical protein